MALNPFDCDDTMATNLAYIRKQQAAAFDTMSKYGAYCGVDIVSYSPATRMYQLADGSSVPYETVHDWPSPPRLGNPVRLEDKRELKWRNRMLRIRDKLFARHRLTALKVLLVLVWTWGSLLAIAMTALCFKLLILLIFG